MLKREETAASILSAIERLGAGAPTMGSCLLLTDKNLLTEAGVSKATLYRSKGAVRRWQECKQRAAQDALTTLEAQISRGSVFEDIEAKFYELARIEPAAWRSFPDGLRSRWDGLRRTFKASVRGESDLVASLVSQLYATTLALRQRDEIISQQAELIERLGGNVRRLRP